ncbi:hypothetical protein IKQ65_02440 [Candidatus Saccharibacteria bacterium]|nr:hypothetical protein [Candidatus Saccharibacteria bacterium]MBR6961440.1 hypothetical protein [Candidatus Saccharibacteria bacterium]
MNIDLSFLSGYEALIAIAIGVFLALFGYKLKRVAYVIIWFVIGYYLASLVVPHITADPTWQKLIPICAGVVLGVFGFSLEKLCIFAVATFAVSTTIIDAFQLTDVLWIALAIAAGVIVGVIAVSFIKPLGIITTALSGGKLIAKYSVLQFSLAHNPNFLIILAVSAAIGILFQFKNCKHIE